MDISKYAEHWENKEKWYLVEQHPQVYSICGQLEDGMTVGVTIEDDNEADAVIQKMKESGSKILSMEEYIQLVEQAQAELLGIDQNTLKQRMRDYIAKYGFPNIYSYPEPDDDEQ